MIPSDKNDEEFLSARSSEAGPTRGTLPPGSLYLGTGAAPMSLLTIHVLNDLHTHVSCVFC